MRKVNLTVELEYEEIQQFEHWLSQFTKVTYFSVLSETKEMYNEDALFRGLVAHKKKASKAIADYIHNHNEKYNGKDTE